MRISSTKRWLAAALSLGRVGVRAALVEFSDFEFTEISPEGFPIFVFEKNPEPQKMFSWRTANTSIKIEQVSLYVFNENSQSPENPPIAVAIVPSDGMQSLGAPSPTTAQTTSTTATPLDGQEPAVPTQSLEARAAAIERIGDSVRLAIKSYPGGGSVTIDDIRKLGKYQMRRLFLGAAWLDNMGETFSRAFTVVETERELQLLISVPNSPFSNPSPVQPEATYSPRTSTTANPTASATSFSNGNGRDPTGVPGRVSESSNQGGLATGAVIGIAVACGVLGLLLVALGVWFLIRRRNKQSNSNHQPLVSPGGPYGAHRSRTDDLIAEKEASAGSADPSPHSPYSDDGVGLPGVAVGSASAAATAPIIHQQIPRLPQPHDQHGRSYTPYSDRGSINGGVGGGGVVGGGSPSTHAASIVRSPSGGAGEEAAGGGMGSPTAGRSTPHSSLAPRYAHLVEEGMTEDEIRRLEDEERQLDADIAEARQR